jgi:2-polyprenyl-3-methyl-5-hydroxy-6-metoxy-1,4-benzoquinol methylase
MAYLFGPLYARIWADAVSEPGSRSLIDSLAAEVADFYRISHDEALARMKATWSSRSGIQAAAFNRTDIQEYYRRQEYSILTGMYWHSLVPDTWALASVAALHAAQRFASGSRLLEFGHGVGSTAILFAGHGFNLTLAEISEPVQKFAQWRLARRNIEAVFTLDSATLAGDPFDVVVSMDVMEHLDDPLRTIEHLVALLAPGGVLIMNVAFGLDPKQPEHLIKRRRGVLDRIRTLGLQRANLDTPFVFYKPSSPQSNPLARVVDTTFAAWEDARHARFKVLAALVRRLRVHELPELLPPSPRLAAAGSGRRRPIKGASATRKP